MSKHGYRMVGYGGLVNDIYRSNPETTRIEFVNVPPVQMPAVPQQQFVTPPVFPERIKQAIEKELDANVDIAHDVINKSLDLYKLFMKGKGLGLVDGEFNIQATASSDATITKPTFDISIDIKLPK